MNIEPHTRISCLNCVESEPTYYYKGIAEVTGKDGVWPLSERYNDLASHVLFNTADRVLDVGCAEGLISMEVAPQVTWVDALEYHPERVQVARQIAEARGISNIAFMHGSIVGFRPPAEAYDVVLFLGVFHHLRKQHKLNTFIKLLTITKRVLAMRTPLLHPASPNRLINLYKIIEAMNFVVTIHPNGDKYGGNLMIISRNQ